MRVTTDNLKNQRLGAFEYLLSARTDWRPLYVYYKDGLLKAHIQDTKGKRENIETEVLKDERFVYDDRIFHYLPKLVDYIGTTL